MKRLEFTENVCDEPIAVSETVFEKYLVDDCDDILVNGVVTHIINNPAITSYDTDKIKTAVQEIIDRIRMDTEGFTSTTVSANQQLVITACKKGSDYVFNSIVIRPAISTDHA
jgi:hypothetical protein